MNAFEKIKDDLNDCVKKALSSGVIANPKIGGDFFKNKNKITSKYSFFKNEIEYLQDYSKTYDEGRFLFNMNDGSFFQINYEFKVKSKNKIFLEKMNLCYLPNVIYGQAEKPYIRIDYFFHSDAHLHIGFNNSIRLPLSETMLFSEFFELILYCFYEKEYKKYFGLSKIKKLEYDADSPKLTERNVLAKCLMKGTFVNVKN